MRAAARRLVMLCGLMAGLGAGPALAETPAWRVNPEASAITVAATQMGGRFEGRFLRFEADIRFDPERLEASRVAVTIETGSLDTGNDQRDAAARGQEWFDVAGHPLARFEASTFRRLDGGRYAAEGTLTIKGRVAAVTLPFTLSVDGDRARVLGTLTVARTDFALGTGEWATIGIVGDEVEIRVELVADRG